LPLVVLSDVITVARRAIRPMYVANVSRLGLRFNVFDMVRTAIRQMSAYSPDRLFHNIPLTVEIKKQVEDTPELHVVLLVVVGQLMEREAKDRILPPDLEEPTHKCKPEWSH
jgi:hypothetical protein